VEEGEETEEDFSITLFTDDFFRHPASDENHDLI
jgi:hypothetical protein